jgi:hypothetical protein
MDLLIGCIYYVLSFFLCFFKGGEKLWNYDKQKRHLHHRKKVFCYLREGICGDRGRFEGYIEWDS